MKKQWALAWGAFTLFSLAYAASDSDWGRIQTVQGFLSDVFKYIGRATAAHTA